MTMSVLFACAVLVLVPTVFGQVFQLGSCPTPTASVIAAPANLVGSWFVFKEYYNLIESTKECTSVDVTGVSPFAVTVRPYSKVLFSYNTYRGTLTATAGSGTITATFPAVLAGKTKTFTVLSSDFAAAADNNKFIIVWECINLVVGNAQFAWVLTKSRTPPTAAVIQAIDTILTGAGLKVNSFIPVNQAICP